MYAHGAVSLWQRLRTVHYCIVLGEPPVSHCVLFPVMYTYATYAVLVVHYTYTQTTSTQTLRTRLLLRWGYPFRNFLDNNNMGTAGYTQSAANPCGLHEEWQVYQARILLNVNFVLHDSA